MKTSKHKCGTGASRRNSEILDNSQTELSDREKKKTFAKVVSSVTASAAGAVEINLAKFKTSTTMLLRAVQCERRKHVFLLHNIIDRNAVTAFQKM